MEIKTEKKEELTSVPLQNAAVTQETHNLEELGSRSEEQESMH